MRPRFLILSAALIAGACSHGAPPHSTAVPTSPPLPPASSALPPGVEAISLLGDTLHAFPIDSAARARTMVQLAAAQGAYDRHPTDADSIIGSVGGSVRSGVCKRRSPCSARASPCTPTTRGCTASVVTATSPCATSTRPSPTCAAPPTSEAGKPDQVEPDQNPNPAHPPSSTLHSSIRYHSALAYYLTAQYELALPIYRSDLAAAKNDEERVAFICTGCT